MTASLSADGLTVTLRGPSWREVFAVGQLGARLRFYRGLAARGARDKGKAGPWARHYAATIAALEAVAAQVKQAQGAGQ